MCTGGYFGEKLGVPETSSELLTCGLAGGTPNYLRVAQIIQNKWEQGRVVAAVME